jgi:hypothetical protein
LTNRKSLVRIKPDDQFKALVREIVHDALGGAPHHPKPRRLVRARSRQALGIILNTVNARVFQSAIPHMSPGDATNHTPAPESDAIAAATPKEAA